MSALAYLAAPALGTPIDSASLISAAAAAPVAAKVIAKTTVAAPFVFHSLNGIRHLVSSVNWKKKRTLLITFENEIGLGYRKVSRH